MPRACLPNVVSVVDVHVELALFTSVYLALMNFGIGLAISALNDFSVLNDFSLNFGIERSGLALNDFLLNFETLGLPIDSRVLSMAYHTVRCNAGVKKELVFVFKKKIKNKK